MIDIKPTTAILLSAIVLTATWLIMA